jgi:hypothetical protein
MSAAALITVGALGATWIAIAKQRAAGPQADATGAPAGAGTGSVGTASTDTSSEVINDPAIAGGHRSTIVTSVGTVEPGLVTGQAAGVHGDGSTQGSIGGGADAAELPSSGGSDPATTPTSPTVQTTPLGTALGGVSAGEPVSPVQTSAATTQDPADVVTALYGSRVGLTSTQISKAYAELGPITGKVY